MLPIYADTFYIIFCSPPLSLPSFPLVGSEPCFDAAKKRVVSKREAALVQWASPMDIKICVFVCVFTVTVTGKMVNGWLVIRFNYLLMIVK